MYLQNTEPGAWDAGSVEVRSAGGPINSTDNEVVSDYQADQRFLSAEAEHALATRYRDSGDVKARNKLVMSHMPLVRRIASTFRGYEHPPEDLISAGSVGLLRAAERFDPTRARFSTYAGWWVKAEIRDYCERNGSIVKPPSRTVPARDTSLNEQITLKDGDCVERINLVVDPPPTPEEAVASTRNEELLTKTLDVLSPRELRIFTARRLDDDQSTLDTLAAEFGISRERIRQIELRAAEKAKREAQRVMMRAPKRTRDPDVDRFLDDYYRF